MGTPLKVWLMGTATISTLTLLASGCGAQFGSQDKSAAANSSTCQPAWDRVNSDIASKQYYSVIFGFRSCLGEDLPLSSDIGPSWDTGAKLTGIAADVYGANANADHKGGGIIPDAGNGILSGTTAATSIPKGDGNNGYGALSGFRTVPAWEGLMPYSQGPCSNSVRIYPPKLRGEVEYNPCLDDQNKLVPPPSESTQWAQTNDFHGEWAVYLPGSTIIATVVHQFPFEYVPEWSDNHTRKDGSFASGVLLYRINGRGQPVPFMGKESTAATANTTSSSPSGSIIPMTSCVDPGQIVDGREPPPSPPPTHTSSSSSSASAPPPPQPGWYTQLSSKSLHKSWNVTVNSTFGQAGVPPTLLLPKGWMVNRGDIQNSARTVPLGGDPSNPISTKPHLFRTVLTPLNGVTCSNEMPTLIGGFINKITASATLNSPLIANSTIYNPSMPQTSMSDSSGPPSFSFSRFLNMTYTQQYSPTPTLTSPNPTHTPPAPTPTNVIGAFNGASFDNTNFTGAVFDKPPNWSSAKGAKFYYADLSRTTFDGKAAGLVGAKYCNTIRPPGTYNNVYNSAPHIDNTNCNDASLYMTKPPEESGNCTVKTCLYGSFYNNTTRTLTKGLQTCLYGEKGSLQAPAVISPLETGQFSFNQSTSYGNPADNGKILCSITYTNGSWGKVRISVTNLDSAGNLKSNGDISAKVDSGYCPGPAASPAWTNDDCLPKAADPNLPELNTGVDKGNLNKTAGLWPPAQLDGNKKPVPVKFSYSLTQPGDKDPKDGHVYKARMLNVALCEPMAYSQGSCATTNFLPTYAKSAGLTGQIFSAAPNSIPTKGGTSITLSGDEFVPGSTVKVGNSPATAGTTISPYRMTFIAPAAAASGAADITVTAPDGSTEKLANGLNYYGAPTAPQPPTATIIMGPDSKPISGQATVAVLPGYDNVAPIEYYTVMATGTSRKCIIETATATSCTITALAKGYEYTFTATATNEEGTSPASSASEKFKAP